MLIKRCPRADELRRLAQTGEASEKVRRHVKKCETCSRIVADLGNEAVLIATIQSVAREFDNRTHSRILEICRRIGSVVLGARVNGSGHSGD